jgi:hypothetical protein
MSNPTKYVQAYGFSDFASHNPSTPLPGDRVDIELALLERSSDEIVDALADIRRSDGRLVNGIVTYDAVDPSLKAGVGAGVPSGGTDGQVLVKSGVLDYVTQWMSAAAAWVTLTVLGHLATRTLVKALVPSAGMAVFLSEAGREGTFVWRTGNYSARIAADTREGIYLKADSIASSAGAWVRAYAGSVEVDWFGAIGDGATNDSAAFNAALAALGATGGAVHVTSSKMYVIDSDVTVPSNCFLVGSMKMAESPGHNFSAPWGQIGAIVLNSAARLILKSGAGLRGLLVRRKGMTFPPSLASLASFAGTAISITNDPPGPSTPGPNGASVMDCAILGFNLGIYANNTARLRFANLLVDCNNGVWIDQSGDVGTFENVHVTPVSTLETFTNTSNWDVLERPGVGMLFSGPSADGAVITGGGVYGHQIGIRFDSGNGARLSNMWVEYPLSGSHRPGTQGITFGSNGASMVCSNCSVWGYESAYVSNGVVGYENRLVDCGAFEYLLQGIALFAGDLRVDGFIFASSATGAIGINVIATAPVLLADSLRFQGLTGLDILVASGCDTSHILIGERIYTDKASATAAISSNLVLKQIASASTIDLPRNGKFFEITGTTNIGTIRGHAPGRRVTLRMNGALSLATGGNLTLPGGVNLSLSAGHLVSLIGNSTTWEVESTSKP